MHKLNRSFLIKGSLVVASAAVLGGCGGALSPRSSEAQHQAPGIPLESANLKSGDIFIASPNHRRPRSPGQLLINGAPATKMSDQRLIGEVQLDIPDSVASGTVDSLQLVGGRLVAQGGRLYIRHGVSGVSNITVTDGK